MPNPDPWVQPGVAWSSAPVQIVRPLTPSAGGGDVVEVILDNAVAVSVTQRTGTDPGRASFRYVFGNGDPDAPQSAEAAVDDGTQLPKLVNPGDQVWVRALRPDGVVEYLFRGIAIAFGLTIDGSSTGAGFDCEGIARELWAEPIGGAHMRHADRATEGGDAGDPLAADNSVDTDLPAVFNPRVDGKMVGNATPAGADRTAGDLSYPVFMDPLAPPGDRAGRLWTLSMAAAYLVFHHNAAEYAVKNPTRELIDGLLRAYLPTGDAPMDLEDSSTYEKKEITCPTKPITGRDWPTTLFELIRDKGFGMAFRTGAGDDGPETRLELFTLQESPVKDLWLQPRGDVLDPYFSNLGRAELARDIREVANEWEVVGARERFEGSFVLAPMFPMVNTDGSDDASLRAYDKSAGALTGEKRDHYRLYGFDETGEGHYALGPTGEEPLTDVAPLAGLIGEGHAIRRRPADGDLISSSKGVPYKAWLRYSRNYTGPSPGLWDGTGDWTTISRGWALCDDRLGIRVTVDQPNSWGIGEDSDGAAVVLKGVEDQAAVDDSRHFTLLLTAVVEGDLAVKGVASRRDASPIGTVVRRTVDASDRYRKETVGATTMLNEEEEPAVVRDDTDLAAAEAGAYRMAAEMGVLAGTVEIPYLTTYYRVGDRIRRISGRGLGLRTDGGLSGSTPVYPIVEAVTWALDGERRTILSLSDEAAERHQVERKIRR